MHCVPQSQISIIMNSKKYRPRGRGFESCSQHCNEPDLEMTDFNLLQISEPKLISVFQVPFGRRTPSVRTCARPVQPPQAAQAAAAVAAAAQSMNASERAEICCCQNKKAFLQNGIQGQGCSRVLLHG